MKKIKGGCQGESWNTYSCSTGNGSSFTMEGTYYDMQTMVLLTCGPCTYSCVVC